MDIILLVKAVVLGIVEGLTEFLPISSTGHLILAGEALHFSGETAKLFEVFIQLGAILAVLWIYRAKCLSLVVRFPKDKQAQRFGVSLLIAFLPAAIVGLVVHKAIKQYLFGPVTVAIALIVGGLVILFIERQKHSNKVEQMEDITFKIALAVGLAQVLALFPGVSRSGATIMGGLLAGMSRKASTEFSFFLAIPTMLAATLFDLAKSYSLLSFSDFQMLAIGFVFAFLSALWVITWLIKFVSTHDFKPFAYYRIVFGGILLCYYLFKF
ncbi:MAG: undecaprenyl-diphosphate phosphatase [Elusimicrobia bacterium]|nr:undecaprenyl-diphosphate phosphatase [Elusimicrobiota bacterium]MBU2614135.1 undecaprenyl-diphosphate phosphatase [Elusimicrobiota bacterium]